MGTSDCSSVDAEHEGGVAVVGVGCGGGYLGEHAWALVADPASTAGDEDVHQRGVHGAVWGVEVGDHCAVEDHDGAVLGCLVDLLGHLV